MIAQLKKEIQRLKAELAMATGQEYAGELTEEELERYTYKCLVYDMFLTIQKWEYQNIRKLSLQVHLKAWKSGIL